MKRKSLDKKKLRHSFKYALKGIKTSLEEEQNMLIHFTFAILVIILGFILKISFIEWIVCLLLIGLVITLELINTAIENTCDAITLKKNKYIKKAKDTSAAAVFVMAIISAIIGLIIFIPKLLEVVK